MPFAGRTAGDRPQEGCRAQVLTMTVEVKKFPAARWGSGRSLSGSSTAITTVTAIS
jgi:hypothetical protein